ncbi:glucosamine-6-phosphate deaminase [Limnohabitans sp. DM1]|uniref:glucosamine-6-phosphate deaminase n=1 Tax=Limnohabitans sp. DM1 TaxID=1597955 RepID=UPI000ABB6E0B|nr:glucosamine-6-phosphate deaminase [Limnohabitans sp. DM1]
MEIIIQASAQAATEIASRTIAHVLRRKPHAVLGLATGSTPVQLYKLLIDMNLDWRQVSSFNLDEYVGLPKAHPQSYHSFMWANLFKHINIDPQNVHIPDGNAPDMASHCLAYEQKIRQAGGIDLQVLGIGTDGHIGFNEPSSSLGSRTRIKTLTRQTRQDNARFFGNEDQVPSHVITMGIGTIMDARQHVLLAFGPHKARAVAQTVEGPITAMVPASILQMHPDTRVYLDPEAAEQLQRSDYYRWVFEHKPLWQRV